MKDVLQRQTLFLCETAFTNEFANKMCIKSKQVDLYVTFSYIFSYIAYRIHNLLTSAPDWNAVNILWLAYCWTWDTVDIYNGSQNKFGM